MAQEFEGPVTINGSVEKGALLVANGPLRVQDGTLMVHIPGEGLFGENVTIIGGGITATESIHCFGHLSSPKLHVSEMFSTGPIAVHGGLDIKGQGSNPGNVKVDADIFASGTIEATKNLKSAQLNVGQISSTTSGPVVVLSGLDIKDGGGTNIGNVKVDANIFAFGTIEAASNLKSGQLNVGQVVSTTAGPIVVRAGLEVTGEGNERDVNVTRGNVRALNMSVQGNFDAPFGFVNCAGGQFRGSVNVTGNLSVAGDIRLENADCAEEFEADRNCGQPITPGMVMVLGDEGRLRPSSSAYDKRVAGVVSGGGDYKPGIILGNGTAKADGIAVALLGRVACHVDATHESVEVGDLLTTSDTPGYAMKASDSSRAFGAVIGKALRPLREGKALVPILVALQ